MLKKLEYFSLIFALILSFLFIKNFFKDKVEFENLALGTQTTVFQARNKFNELIHLTNFDSIQYNQIKTNKHLNKDSLTLVLGNSQTHSINQYKNGQFNLITLLDQDSKYQNKVFATTLPNANLQEFYLIYSYVSKKYIINKLIIPIFFDDMRENEIRSYFLSQIKNEKFKIPTSDSNLVAQKINVDLYKNSYENQNENISSNITIQDDVENRLNTYLNLNTSVWAKRPIIRGELFDFLYKLRNTIFNIRPNSIRPKITENYNSNFDALKQILILAKQNKTDVLLYIPPIRYDVKLPYNIKEYNIFKNDVFLLQESSVHVINCENIVPAYLWGYKDPTNFVDKKDIDFMHFQFQGHIILSNYILKNLNDF